MQAYENMIVDMDISHTQSSTDSKQPSTSSVIQLLKDVQTHSKICQGSRQAFVTGKISCDIPLPAHYDLQYFHDWAIQLIVYEYTITDTLYTLAGRSSHTKATNVIRLHRTLQMGEYLF